MRTLLMLSGGLDSTAALYKLLTETDDEVHAHWIYYKNQQARYDAERIAIRQIVPFFKKNFRDFRYSENEVDFTQIGNPEDVHVVRFVAAQICLKNPIDRVATGKVKDDENPEYFIRAKSANHIFNACMIDRYPLIPQIFFPIGEMRKTDILRYLPSNIIEMVWYCRTPIWKWENRLGEQVNVPHTCRQCKTCRQMEDARREIL